MPLPISPDPWDAQAVAQGIAQTRFAGQVRYLPIVTSTSTLALEAAQSGAPEGAVWVADEQTAGRGRGGHTWHSAPTEGLYFSLLLRPTLPPDKALWLSLLTGLSVQSAIAEVTGLQPDLRWPNDLLLGEKKFGGILVETSLSTQAEPTLRHAVIGIGLNIAHRTLPPDLQPIANSLYLATGTLYPRETILAAALRALEANLQALEVELSGHPTAPLLLERFTQSSTWVQGKSVRVGEAESYTGFTAGLDPRGFLLVQTPDGTLRTVLSGGVRPA